MPTKCVNDSNSIPYSHSFQKHSANQTSPNCIKKTISLFKIIKMKSLYFFHTLHQMESLVRVWFVVGIRICDSIPFLVWLPKTMEFNSFTFPVAILCNYPISSFLGFSERNSNFIKKDQNTLIISEFHFISCQPNAWKIPIPFIKKNQFIQNNKNENFIFFFHTPRQMGSLCFA